MKQDRKVYVFYGLMRSGNHAIIHWIINNLAGEEVPSVDGTKIFATDSLVYFNDITNVFDVNFEKYSDYDTIIASVEEFYIDPWCSPIRWILHGRRVSCIFIERELMDCLKSRSKKFGKNFARNTEFRVNKLIESFNSILYRNKKICYESWLEDKDYRDNIMKFFNSTNSIDRTDKIAVEGGGSSFITPSFLNNSTQHS